MKVLVRKGNCLDFAGDVILFFHYSDIRPLKGALGLLDWRCNGIVSRLMKKKRGLFDFGRMSILAPQGKIPAAKVLITGLGPAGSMDSNLRTEALRIALKGAGNVASRKIALDTGILEKDLPEEIGQDLERILGELNLEEPFTIALFRSGRQSSGKSGEEWADDGRTVEA